MEQLTADEMEYHRKMQRNVDIAQSCWLVWGQHLAQKYGLGPQDTITVEGEIKRAPAPKTDETQPAARRRKKR